MWVFVARNHDLAPIKIEDRIMDDLIFTGVFLAAGIYNMPIGDMTIPSSKFYLAASPDEIRNRRNKGYIIKANPAKAIAYAVRGYIDLLKSGMASYDGLSRPFRRKFDKGAKNSGTSAKEIFDKAKKDIAVMEKFAYWLGRSSGFDMRQISEEDAEKVVEKVRDIVKID